jgi:hypothetical protein
MPFKEKSVELFSKRHGFSSVEEAEITVREDAPEELRGFLIQLTYEHGLKPSALRSMVCKVLKKMPDPSNWSEYPNVNGEVTNLIFECKWYKVYDILERVLHHLGEINYDRDVYDSFVIEVNDYFIENGIGWKIENGLLEFRGTEAFEVILKNAQSVEKEAGHLTASKELHQAIGDLSRRPHPDATGAIQHAMASLECVAREITGDRKANLGEIMNRHTYIVPEPLDQVIIKAWGYASENGRHIREGREPSLSESELIVGLCASLGGYLIKCRSS